MHDFRNADNLIESLVNKYGHATGHTMASPNWHPSLTHFRAIIIIVVITIIQLLEIAHLILLYFRYMLRLDQSFFRENEKAER